MGLSQFNETGDGDMFQDLTRREYINTDGFCVVNIIIAYGSKYAIALVYDDKEDKFEIQGCSLEELGARMFTFDFQGEYIKMKEIEQNDAGDTYAIAYQNNGVFFVRIINN